MNMPALALREKVGERNKERGEGEKGKIARREKGFTCTLCCIISREGIWMMSTF